MSRYPNPYARTSTYETTYAGNPAAVATFMNTVYAWMCAGLALTGVVGWYVASESGAGIRQMLFGGPGMIVLFLAILALPWIISGAINKMSSVVATMLFLLYATLLGAALSGIFIRYTLGSIGLTFGVTAGTFATMSVIGFVTKKDLTNLGGFLLMAFIGIIIASIANFFMQSPMLYWLITYAGVLIFMGLTAYHTQMLKGMAASTDGDGEMAARLAIVGALILYIDFVNMFLYLLRILGKARE